MPRTGWNQPERRHTRLNRFSVPPSRGEAYKSILRLIQPPNQGSGAAAYHRILQRLPNPSVQVHHGVSATSRRAFRTSWDILLRSPGGRHGISGHVLIRSHHLRTVSAIPIRYQHQCLRRSLRRLMSRGVLTRYLESVRVGMRAHIALLESPRIILGFALRRLSVFCECLHDFIRSGFRV